MQSRRRENFLLTCIFFLILALTCFMFRDIISKIKPLMSGDSVLVREELVPFYNVHTQFLDQLTFGKSPLTQTDEIRISYSFWTSWVRYWKILPFALILMNAVSWFIFFISTYIISKRVFEGHSPARIAWLSLIPSSFIFLLILYSKVTHFYTLIFGFSLFALAVSLSLVTVFFRQGKNVSLNVWICLLVLFNPAIHYHVLYYFILVILLPLAYFYEKIKKNGAFGRYLRLGIFNVFISLIPYAAFILFAMNSSSADVSTTIPVTYSSIFFSSNYVMHLFSFDISSQADMFFQGNYLVEAPRSAKMLFFLMLLVPLFQYKSEVVRKNRLFLIICYAIFGVSFWMSIGYTHALTFHSIGADFMKILYNSSSWGVELIKRLAGATIQILRFPHRFEFILFYMASILAMFSLFAIRSKVNGVLFAMILLVIFAGPMLSDADYRGMLLSGNMNGFMKPFTIPSDLSEIKKIVNLDPGLGIVLPTMESGREIMEDGTRYSFIDKFLIYYLDNPFMYYGTASELGNKVESFLVYQSVLYDQGWWDQILAKSMRVKYILVPHATSRLLGNTYLPDIDANLLQKINESGIYKLEFSGQYFSLYKAVTEDGPDKDILFDIPVKHYDAQFKTALMQKSSIYFLSDMAEFLSGKKDKYLVTDNPEEAYYDVIADVDKENAFRFYPDTEIVPFSSSYISSTFYTNTPLSLKTLLLPGENYNLTRRSIPDLINAESLQFMSVVGNDNKIKFNFKAKAGKKVVLLLKLINDENTVSVMVNGKSVEFKRIEGESNTFSYFYSEYVSPSDEGVLMIGNKKVIDSVDSATVVAESLLVVDSELAFQDGPDGKGGGSVRLYPAGDDQYKLIIRKQ